jgi:hypothetical protein
MIQADWAACLISPRRTTRVEVGETDLEAIEFTIFSLLMAQTREAISPPTPLDYFGLL